MIPANPFTPVGRVLHYHGEPVYLAGKYPTAAVPLDGLPDTDYELVMRRFAANRNNFFRHWIFPYWLYTQPGNAYSPFRRPNGRWNLMPPYNADYFRRLDRMLRAAQHHGIVVQITIFDATGLKAIKDIRFPGEPTDQPARHTRWEISPWNDATNAPQGFIHADGGGLDEFFDLAGIPGLEQAQRALVDQVVGCTMGYWNVCYELMNECIGGAEANQEKRVRWMDAVTGWIDAKTRGNRLVFHSDYGEGANQSGADVDFWCRNSGRFTNYARLDGIIFHNNPRTVKPAADPRYACFRGQKVFQVSTDAFDRVKREEFAWNRDTTQYAFTRKMIYQAEASSDGAARGIGQAAPSPTDLRLAPFTHLYRKTSAGGPRFDLRFFVDGGQGFFIAYHNAAPFGELSRGRVEDFRFDGETRSVRLYDRLVDQTHWWRYTFGGDTLTLENEETLFRQTFRRVHPRARVEALVPFLYNWERVAASGDPHQHYSMRFDIDGALRTYRLNPYRQMDHHDVVSVSPSADPARGAITFYRFLNAHTATWHYTFETAQRLRLATPDGAVFQLFEQRPWFIPDSAVTAPAAADVSGAAADAETAASPLATGLATV